MPTPRFAVCVTFECAPEHAEVFKDALTTQAKNSVAREADCHQFDVAVDPGSPSKFFLYETYTDAAAFDAHVETAHFAEFNNKVTPWVTHKAVATYEILNS
ncbi:MAG: putative quinol monooxygenase [Planctomycetota bacterium]